MKKDYKRFAWLTSALTEEQVRGLYLLKTQLKKPMTKLVKEAVELYLKQQQGLTKTTEKTEKN